MLRDLGKWEAKLKGAMGCCFLTLIALEGQVEALKGQVAGCFGVLFAGVLGSQLTV